MRSLVILNTEVHIEYSLRLQSVTHFLNRPLIKEGVKVVVGAISFTFGAIEIYDLVRNRSFKSSSYIQTAAKVSLILSAMVSRPGVWVISTLVGRVFAPEQLQRVFGANTIFALNPWHPRHVCSIAAVILAIPSVIHSTYLGIHSLMRYSIFSQQLRFHVECEQPSGQLSDREVRGMILFNTLTSRPIMHLGNQLCRAMVK